MSKRRLAERRKGEWGWVKSPGRKGGIAGRQTERERGQRGWW